MYSDGEFATKAMTEDGWKVLLGRIKEGKCTPFLGAGVDYVSTA